MMKLIDQIQAIRDILHIRDDFVPLGPAIEIAPILNQMEMDANDAKWDEVAAMEEMAYRMDTK